MTCDAGKALVSFVFSYEGPTIAGRIETRKGFRRYVLAADSEAAWVGLAEQLDEPVSPDDEAERLLGDVWALLTCEECLRTEEHSADCPALLHDLWDASKGDLVDEVVEMRAAIEANEAAAAELRTRIRDLEAKVLELETKETKRARPAQKRKRKGTK